MTPENNSSHFPQITIKSPFVNLYTACAAEALHESKMMELIKAGQIRFAWNIASKNSGKVCVRILARSIADYQAGRVVAPQRKYLHQLMRYHAELVSDTPEFQSVLKEIFPFVSARQDGCRYVLPATLQKTFNTGDEHIRQLIQEKSLRLVRGSVARRGPGGTPQIDFTSVKSFLIERRIS